MKDDIMGSKLYIKNMVCDRCKMVVKTQLEESGLHPVSIELGVIELAEDEITQSQQDIAKAKLESVGFELLEDKKSQIIEAIKTAIIELIRKRNDDDIRLKLSDYIASTLRYDYNYLSSQFSEAEGITIEQFAIQQRIERVKELLAYGELSLKEIAYDLGYSSIAALSGQFKKVMHITPTAWKASNPMRKPLDKVGKDEPTRQS